MQDIMQPFLLRWHGYLCQKGRINVGMIFNCSVILNLPFTRSEAFVGGKGGKEGGGKKMHSMEKKLMALNKFGDSWQLRFAYYNKNGLLA